MVNEELILVSEIKSMSTIRYHIFTSESNLFRKELMLSCIIINLLGFFDVTFSIYE